MEQEIKETLHVIVGMIEELGRKVDGLEREVQEMKVEIQEMKVEMQGMKEEQQRMNERLEVLSSAYGRHEVAIQLLEKKKII